MAPHVPNDDLLQAATTIKKPLEKYTHPPETKHELKYADLVTLDLSDFDNPGGKERLAAQLKDTAHQVGFFYIEKIGLTQEQIDQQFAIGKEFFALPEKTRMQYRAPLEEGNYNGYRPLGSIEILPGLYDNLEFYNVFKFIPQTQRSQPDIVNQYWSETERFHRHMHENVTYKLLRLLAIILELPEFSLVDGHLYEANCDSALRYMMYRARSQEENDTYKDLYLRGHTDNGTLTYVFQQPVSALQVKRNEESDWEHIHVPEGLVVVNIADILQFLTNGYLKSGIHRVIAPPDDQCNQDRLGLLYFVRPSDRLPLKTLDSPFLQKVGYGKTTDANDYDIPASEWVRARVRKNWTRSPSDHTESVKMGGFNAKVFYN